VTDVVLVSAITTDDIPRKFLSDHMFLTSSFMVYRKIKNCDKFGMTKSDKVDKIILKVPMSKYVPIILRTENVPFGVLSQHIFWQKRMWKQQSPHKRCQTLRTPEDSEKKSCKIWNKFMWSNFFSFQICAAIYHLLLHMVFTSRNWFVMQGPVAISWNVIFIWETGYWNRAIKRFALFDLLKSLYSDTKILSKYIPSLQKRL
jgi:hypothetical protein